MASFHIFRPRLSALRWLRILAASSALSTCLSCATGSGTIGMEELDENNQANGAAYLVDAMHVRRPMPGHKDWKPLQFYFKHCTEMGEEIYYSKTSYDCTDPF